MLKRCILFVMVVLLLCGCSGKGQQWQEQYDLGMRYLSEGDYEEAILAFSAAIDIDPKRADAYVMRGDAYVMAAKADPEHADKYLRKARRDYDKAEDLDEDLESEMERKREELEQLEEEIAAANDGGSNGTDNLQIPEGALVFNGHSYAVVDGLGSWEEACAVLASMGGYPAVITSLEENNAIYAYMLELGYDCGFFGLTDIAQEGVWTWVNGEESEYRNWADGEPNAEDANENYAMFYYLYTDGTWNDGGIDPAGVCFICEWNTAEDQNATEPNKNWLKKDLYNFDAFLQEKGYLSYWTDSVYSPAEYALADLNSDGLSELIVLSGTDNGFFAYQVFCIVKETGAVIPVYTEGANPGYFYGTIGYAPEQSALVVCPMRLGSMGVFFEYHVFDGTGFFYAGDVGRTDSGYFDSRNGNDLDISQEAYSAIMDAVLSFETAVLP